MVLVKRHLHSSVIRTRKGIFITCVIFCVLGTCYLLGTLRSNEDLEFDETIQHMQGLIQEFEGVDKKIIKNWNNEFYVQGATTTVGTIKEETPVWNNSKEGRESKVVPGVSFVSVEEIPTTTSTTTSTEIPITTTTTTDGPTRKQKRFDNFLRDFDSFSLNVDANIHNSDNNKIWNISTDTQKYPWTYACKNGKCIKKLRLQEPDSTYVSLDACWLKCGADSSSFLWPKPRKSKISSSNIEFNLDNLLLKSIQAPSSTDVGQLAKEAFNIMKQNIKLLYPTHYNKTKEYPGLISVSLEINTDTQTVSILTDESYNLKIKQVNNKTELKVIITGDTFFGIRHGLETLSQMIIFDDAVNCLLIPSEVKIYDYPEFVYRGLMIDSARNFIPITSIQRVIEGMSHNKLNMLHWHLTDSNSFPFYSTTYPQMTDYGAYSEEEIYYPEEIKKLVEYARVRGVQIIPELDAPAHAGHGWQWGEFTPGYGKLALQVNYEPFHEKCGQPPCGTLNPVNPKTYEVLRGLYGDMLSAFNSDLFHMGGDEVFAESWMVPEIKRFLKQHKINNANNMHMLQLFFQKKAFAELKLASKGKNLKTPTPILWSSDMLNYNMEIVEAGFVSPEDYIVQYWGSQQKEILDLLSSNFSLILSNQDKVYLDLGVGSWMGRGHDWKYINWQVLYNYNLNSHGKKKKVPNSRYGNIPQILGGEAALWSEKVNEITMESRLWPRGTAFAERLWSNPGQSQTASSVYGRLLYQNERMRKRGILVDTRQPKSCLQNTNCENLNDFPI